MVGAFAALKGKEQWQGCDLTWTTKADIKKALKKKGLPIDTPLRGVEVFRVKKFRGAGWKMLLVKDDQSEFIMYKKQAA
jgi:hypothetical protein